MLRSTKDVIHSESKKESNYIQSLFKSLPESVTIDYLWLSALRDDTYFNRNTLMILRDIDIKRASKSIKTLEENKLIKKDIIRNRYQINKDFLIFARHLLKSKGSINQSLLRLGLNWQELHQRIILRYQECQNFEVLNKDIYFINNLFWHVEEGEWLEHLYHILDNVLVANRTNINQIFTDVVSLTDSKDIFNTIQEKKKIEKGYSDTYFINQVKYSLFLCIHNYWLSKIPIQWIKELIERDELDVSIAHKVILKQSSKDDFIQSVQVLKKYLSNAEILEVLELSNSINCERTESRIYLELYKRLDTKNKYRIIERVKSFDNEHYISQCIQRFILFSPNSFLENFLDISNKIKDEHIKCELLVELSTSENIKIKETAQRQLNKISDHKAFYEVLNGSAYTDLIFHFVKTKDLYEMDDCYTKYSLLWKTEKNANIKIDIIQSGFSKIKNHLEKILLLSEILDLCNHSEIEFLWNYIYQLDRNSRQLDFIICFIPYVSSNKLQIIINRIFSNQRSDHKIELLVECHPFGTESQKRQILEEILGEEDTVNKLNALVNIGAVGKLNSTNVENILQTSPNKGEALIALSDYNPKYFETLLQEIDKITDETHRYHLLKQAALFCPENKVLKLFEAITKIDSKTYQKELLNLFTPKIPKNRLSDLIEYYIKILYPKEKFQNLEKQINRTYWEQISSPESLTFPTSHDEHDLDFSIDSLKLINRFLDISDSRLRAKSLMNFLKSNPWENLSTEKLDQIIQAIAEGELEDFIQVLPIITQKIAYLTNPKCLLKFSSLCVKMSQKPTLYSSIEFGEMNDLNQDKENIYQKLIDQEFWQGIA